MGSPLRTRVLSGTLPGGTPVAVTVFTLVVGEPDVWEAAEITVEDPNYNRWAPPSTDLTEETD